MAVEIKELVIRAVVQDDAGEKQDGDVKIMGETQQAAVVRLAVQEVLRILKKSKER